MQLDDETQAWAAALSERHRAAVARWQGDDRFYEQIQSALAGENDIPEAVAAADTLLEVATHPLAADYTVWRGVRSTETTFGVPADRLEEIIGAGGQLGRFVATSFDREMVVEEFTNPQLKDGGVLIEMHLNRGVRVAWIPPIGHPQLAYQQELLLHPEMVQRIVGMDRSGSVPVVRMEVRPSEQIHR